MYISYAGLFTVIALMTSVLMAALQVRLLCSQKVEWHRREWNFCVTLCFQLSCFLFNSYRFSHRQLRNNDAEDAYTHMKSKCPGFLDALLRDSSAERADLSHAALHTLGCCLHESQFAR